MRKLATVRIIDDLFPIEGADAILLAKIDGWQCVVKKGEFKKGDPCVYFEIDSLIPMRPEIEHLRARAFKRMGDKEGIRIKTIKLRGELSQGIALPLSMFPEIPEAHLNLDLDELLGVVKYEAPVPTQLAGQVKGNFPTVIPKTDQERCQNLVSRIFVDNEFSRYEVSMKLDGTSFTGYTYQGHVGVCGRNWELSIDEDNQDNSLVRMFVDSGLQAVMPLFNRDFAIQGELMGPGIQKNREGFATHKLFIFDIFDITTGKYVSPEDRQDIIEQMWILGVNKDMVQHVPIHQTNVTLKDLGITDVASLLAYSDGPSIVHPVREGYVYKRMDGNFSFKAISNKFLLKEED